MRSINDIQIGLDMNRSGLTNRYTQRESDSEFEDVSRIQVFNYPQESSDTRFYKTWEIDVPNGGNQATITTNACNGYGTNPEGLKNSFKY